MSSRAPRTGKAGWSFDSGSSSTNPAGCRPKLLTLSRSRAKAFPASPAPTIRVRRDLWPLTRCNGTCTCVMSSPKLLRGPPSALALRLQLAYGVGDAVDVGVRQRGMHWKRKELFEHGVCYRQPVRRHQSSETEVGHRVQRDEVDRCADRAIPEQLHELVATASVLRSNTHHIQVPGVPAMPRHWWKLDPDHISQLRRVPRCQL